MVRKKKFIYYLFQAFPFLEWFENYKFEYLKSDLFAGISVALILIPQSMAYAQLAGLPAYYGLYVFFLPPIIAALFGSSCQLATGPVAIVSLMIAAALEPIVSSGNIEYIEYAILMAFLVGIFQIALGTLRLGFLINFLSHPVINGFTNAAALIIATSQLSKVFGVHVESQPHHYETVYLVIAEAIRRTHLPSLGFAILSFFIMIILRRYFPKLPYVFIAVIITTILSYKTGYYKEISIGIVQIRSSRIVEMINSYNNLLNLLQKRSEQRVQTNQKLQVAKERIGPFSKEVNNLEFALISLNLDIQRIKEEVAELRSKLCQEKLFINNSQSKTIVYSFDSLNQFASNNSEVIYLKVGNNKIDPQNIKVTSGADIVGKISQEIPSFKVPKLDFSIIKNIFSYVAIISLLGFLEAISIAKAMATELGQKLNPNRELLGQGLANLVGSFFQSYPVSGSFSRSAVNFQLGAVSGISSVFTGLFVGFSILFFSPYLYYLPQSVLASIIILAVMGLINIHGFLHDWKAQKYDGIVGIITFFVTLYFAPHIDDGIFVGVFLSLVLYIQRGMKPEIVFLSKHPDTTFRNRDRFALQQCKHIAVIRYNGP